MAPALYWESGVFSISGLILFPQNTLSNPHKGTKASMRLHAPAIEPHICFTEKKHFRQRTVVMLRLTYL